MLDVAWSLEPRQANGNPEDPEVAAASFGSVRPFYAQAEHLESEPLREPPEPIRKSVNRQLLASPRKACPPCTSCRPKLLCELALHRLVIRGTLAGIALGVGLTAVADAAGMDGDDAGPVPAAAAIDLDTFGVRHLSQQRRSTPSRWRRPECGNPWAWLAAQPPAVPNALYVRWQTPIWVLLQGECRSKFTTCAHLRRR